MIRIGLYVCECEWCGRRWNHAGRSRSALRARQGKANAMGFIVAACKAHEARCSGRSPAERRTVNLRDETRWASAPPRSLITNPDDHAGLKDPA